MSQQTALAAPEDDGKPQATAKPDEAAKPRKRSRRRSPHNKELGRKGEDAAVRYLERRGYDIVERNWSCIAGEADIIARDDEVVVFIEVKTRTGAANGLPGEAVTKNKRERYEKIACAFLADYDVIDVPVRFDVIAITLIDSDRAMVRHHMDAFGVDW